MAGVRGDQTSLYVKDMYKAEREGYKEVPTKHDQIFSVKSKGVYGAGEKSTQILGPGSLARHTTEDQDIDFKSPIEGFTFMTKYWTYSDGIALSKEAVADTVKLGNVLRDLANLWGKQVRIAKEELGARIFNEGGNLLGDWTLNGSHTGNTDSSGDLAYDGAPLFNLTGNTRSTKGGGTYYNSVASLSLDSTSDFETLYNLHTATNNRDERDDVIQNPADTLLTKVGSDAFLAKQLLGTKGPNNSLPYSDTNNMNPYEDILTHLSWDYLDPDGDENAFFIGKRQHTDFQFHVRQNPEIHYFVDEKNRGERASIDIRIGTMIKNFRCWARGGGTAA